MIFRKKALGRTQSLDFRLEMFFERSILSRASPEVRSETGRLRQRKVYDAEH